MELFKVRGWSPFAATLVAWVTIALCSVNSTCLPMVMVYLSNPLLFSFPLPLPLSLSPSPSFSLSPPYITTLLAARPQTDSSLRSGKPAKTPAPLSARAL